jgi:VWFA-related protein
MTRAFSSAVVLAVLLGAAPSASQSAAPSTKTIDVVVTDASRRPVEGLTAADFEIRGDGRWEPVESCTAVDARTEGRAYLIAIDAVHLSPRRAARVQPALEEFIRDFLEPRDRAAVAWLSSSPQMSDFTSDRRHLLQTIGAASARARSDGAAAAGGIGLEFGAVDSLDATGQTLSALAAALERGRRAVAHPFTVLLISGGLPATESEPRATSDARRSLFAEAARANASIYPIDPAGMAAISSSLVPSEEFEPAGLEQWASLRMIADRTGGRAILGQTDLTPAYREIVQDNSLYYVITYQSQHAANGDVRVRVKRSGLTVTTRKRLVRTDVERARSRAAFTKHALTGLFDRERDRGAVRASPDRSELAIVGPHLHPFELSREYGEPGVAPVRLVVGIFDEPLENLIPDGPVLRFGKWLDRQVAQESTEPEALISVRQMEARLGQHGIADEEAIGRKRLQLPHGRPMLRVPRVANGDERPRINEDHVSRASAGWPDARHPDRARRSCAAADLPDREIARTHVR